MPACKPSQRNRANALAAQARFVSGSLSIGLLRKLRLRRRLIRGKCEPHARRGFTRLGQRTDIGATFLQYIDGSADPKADFYDNLPRTLYNNYNQDYYLTQLASYYQRQNSKAKFKK